MSNDNFHSKGTRPKYWYSGTFSVIVHPVFDVDGMSET